MNITNYMSWVGGVDLAGVHGLSETPNIIVPVVRMVHPPAGLHAR